MKVMAKISASLYMKGQTYSSFSSYSSEVATGAVLQNKLLLKILQNSQENDCARVSF